MTERDTPERAGQPECSRCVAGDKPTLRYERGGLWHWNEGSVWSTCGADPLAERAGASRQEGKCWHVEGAVPDCPLCAAPPAPPVEPPFRDEAATIRRLEERLAPPVELLRDGDRCIACDQIRGSETETTYCGIVGLYHVWTPRARRSPEPVHPSSLDTEHGQAAGVDVARLFNTACPHQHDGQPTRVMAQCPGCLIEWSASLRERLAQLTKENAILRSPVGVTAEQRLEGAIGGIMREPDDEDESGLTAEQAKMVKMALMPYFTAAYHDGLRAALSGGGGPSK